MNIPDNVRGGYVCPHKGCGRRFFIQDFLDDHLRRDHQETQ